MTTRTSLAPVIALLLVLPAGAAQAQVRAGLIGGLNRSSYHDPDREGDFSTENGIVLGGVLDAPLGGPFGLRLEPTYIGKSGTVADAALREEVTFSASMLELPLLLTVGRGGPTRLYALTGPTVALTLSSELSGEDSGVALEADLMEVTQRIDLGATVGGGIGRTFGRASVFVEGRYTWGLRNLMKDGEVEVSSPDMPGTVLVPTDAEDDSYEYRGLQILIGCTLPLGGS